MKTLDLLPSSEGEKPLPVVETKLINLSKKTVIGGMAALVWCVTQIVAIPQGDAHAIGIAGRGELVVRPFLPPAAGENYTLMMQRADDVPGSLTQPPPRHVSKKAEVNLPREKFLDTGKVKINYLDYGNASSEPLVMLHGGAWCWEEYLSLIPFLAQRWHPYALDSRGNGRSGWVPGQYRLEDFTEDTVAFVRQFKTTVVLVGHSLGGAVALMVAARCPDKVKALVIEDTPPTIENYRRVVASGREMYGTWLKLKGSVQSEQELSLALADTYKDYPGVTSQWFMFFARCLWQLDPTYFDALRNDFDSFIKGYDNQLLARIRCPVLFIRGETELGAVMTDEEVSWLKRNFSKVSYTHITGVGHLLHMQEGGQAQVLKAMLEFLERVPK
ncbi:MAG TPA: alpha/beta hydrolase [Geomonas sp.]|nr:alpha/beta hydrolase [Geomonas sp.]